MLNLSQVFFHHHYLCKYILQTIHRLILLKLDLIFGQRLNQVLAKSDDEWSAKYTYKDSDDGKKLDLNSAQEIFGYFGKSYLLDLIFEIFKGNVTKSY